MKRGAALGFALAIGLLAAMAPARAQDAYPSRPIKLIVGFAAAGATDVVARLVARGMSEELGQNVLVENRPGAGGALATDAVAKSPPDGYTLFVGASSNLVMNIALHKNLPFDIDRDLVGIALLTRSSTILFVHPGFPATDLKSLVAQVKANPGKYNYGSAGIGSITHVVFEYFRRAAGNLDIVHIPYRGAGPTVQDLLAGRIEMAIDGMGSYNAHAKSGGLRPIAISPARLAEAPDVPSFAEAGLPDFEGYTWNAVLAPRGTPAAVIDKLNRAVNKALEHPLAAAQFEKLAVEVLRGSTPATTDAFGRRERAKWLPLIRDMDIKAE